LASDLSSQAGQGGEIALLSYTNDEDMVALFRVLSQRASRMPSLTSRHGTTTSTSTRRRVGSPFDAEGGRSRATRSLALASQSDKRVSLDQEIVVEPCIGFTYMTKLGNDLFALPR
jgi:hypothetical protein